MNLWMINHHALTPDMSGGTRHYDFAKELVKRGYKVTIIASSFHYSKHQEMKTYSDDENYLLENVDGIEFIWIKTPPYQGSGFARVKNMLSFMFRVINTIPKLNIDKPDTILGSSVHLFAVYATYVLSRRYKSKFIMEVRDLWPQTLIDMGMSKWHPFILLLGFLERFLYEKADVIVTNLPKAYLYIEKLGIAESKVKWISNGVDLDTIQYNKPKVTENLTIMYTGAIGIANNLDILLDVAIKLKNIDTIKFKIIGAGTEKDRLIKKLKNLNLSSVEFINPVPKTEISDLLATADVLFFNLKDSPVFNYGISSNKLFDYMAAGRVVIFSANVSNNLIKESNGGFTIPVNSVIELEKVIITVNKLKFKQREEIGLKNREYVCKYYSIPILVDKLEQIIKEL